MEDMMALRRSLAEQPVLAKMLTSEKFAARRPSSASCRHCHTRFLLETHSKLLHKA